MQDPTCLGSEVPLLPASQGQELLLWAVQAGDGRQGGKDAEKCQGGEKRDGDSARGYQGSAGLQASPAEANNFNLTELISL